MVSFDPKKMAYDLSLMYVEHTLDYLLKRDYDFSDSPCSPAVEKLEIMYQNFMYAYSYFSDLEIENLESSLQKFEEGGKPKEF